MDLDATVNNAVNAMLFAIDKAKAHSDMLLVDVDRALTAKEADLMNDINILSHEIINNLEIYTSRELDKQVNSFTETLSDSWLIRKKPTVASFYLPMVIKSDLRKEGTSGFYRACAKFKAK